MDTEAAHTTPVTDSGNQAIATGQPPSSAEQVLSGETRDKRLARLLPFLGPAFIASIAYVDPGNFATNIQVMLDQEASNLQHNLRTLFEKCRGAGVLSRTVRPVLLVPAGGNVK